ncbi:chemotaxis protein CheX [Magnetofaba australis]|uniref:Putative inhibitor of MCP methylation-like protein n=1 Tax=Magnetofaba australis IT-1 TaxID=1434232 RepID=A0A1Y2K531_9PROT|nr:chemotaxis protein CheX [Magnetofaba australis]OSM04812.1 putative inhibitor of MCP methylation-like protein [Magnetofaba australis IT-1]
MPETFLDAVRGAVQEIAETMLFLEIEAKESSHGKSEMPVDVSAILGYSGGLRGSVSLSGPESSVLKLASALLGEEREAFDAEMEDAYSELANMIAGGVQSRLESVFGSIKLSTPVIIRGKNHTVTSDHAFECVNHAFALEGDGFCVNVFYHPDSLQQLTADAAVTADADSATQGAEVVDGQ